MCEALCGNKECKSFKINCMRVCEVDQYVRLGFFLDVCGDMGHGLDRRPRPRVLLSRLLMTSSSFRMEGAADSIPSRFGIAQESCQSERFPLH